MYNHFAIPFTIGSIFLFIVLIVKYVRWFFSLPLEDRKKVYKSILSVKTIFAFGDVLKESLLHLSIFKHNRLLGFMHSSLALGWFLLIVIGGIEVALELGPGHPIYVHIFYKFFNPVTEGIVSHFFSFLMDFLLLYVLIGVALAWGKRFKKNSMGIKRRTKHSLGDRLALTALWMIFPIRLLAESVTSGLHDSGSFLTGSLGRLFVQIPYIEYAELPLWWVYSIVLFFFFIALPFSRYMHIFTEIPHIFLKRWGIQVSKTEIKKADNFQVHSCSKCGICIDPCQLQRDLNLNTMQAVYFLKNRRSNVVDTEVIDNCLMCGRCEKKCPVGIDINSLRLANRTAIREENSENRYSYLSAHSPKIVMATKSELLPYSESEEAAKSNPKIGYFAGCMTSLQPATIASMKKIFSKSKQNVWLADANGGVCCGRPLMLTGEVEAAQKMINFNKQLFLESGIKTLVTSCPICVKVFREDYNLEGIEVLHHTEYIHRNITSGKIQLRPSNELFTYHDPCELGRGLGVYNEPRSIIQSIGKLVEAKENREHALCCGQSLANNKLLGSEKRKISNSVLKAYKSTQAERLITACPQCKFAFYTNKEKLRVADISELVAEQM